MNESTAFGVWQDVYYDIHMVGSPQPHTGGNHDVYAHPIKCDAGCALLPTSACTLQRQSMSDEVACNLHSLDIGFYRSSGLSSCDGVPALRNLKLHRACHSTSSATLHFQQRLLSRDALPASIGWFVMDTLIQLYCTPLPMFPSRVTRLKRTQCFPNPQQSVAEKMERSCQKHPP